MMYQVYAKAPDDVCCTLVGSKCDVTTRTDSTAMSEGEAMAVVSQDDIRRISDLYCMSYFSTSAKLNKNIEKVSSSTYTCSNSINYKIRYFLVVFHRALSVILI